MISQTSHSSSEQQIYLLTSRPSAERIRKRLRRVGFEPVDWPGSDVARRNIPKFYDYSEGLPADVQLSRDALNIVYTRAADTAQLTPHNPDIVLTDIRQLETLLPRLNLSQRERRRAREHLLREQTQRTFKPFARGKAAEQRRRMLWLGPEASFLNPLKALLKERKIDLCAAISAYTAEDYLRSESFDLIGLYPKRADDEVIRLLNKLILEKQNSWHKVLILEGETNEIVSGTYAASADLILDTSENIDKLADRLVTLAFSDAEPVGASTPHFDYASTLQTRLASRHYLETHIAAQMKDSDTHQEPLTVMSLAVEKPDQLETLANFILPLLRDSDLAAKMTANSIAVSLPGTNFRGGSKLAKRIQAESPMEVESRIIQKRDYHTANSIIGGLTALTGIKRLKKA